MKKRGLMLLVRKPKELRCAGLLEKGDEDEGMMGWSKKEDGDPVDSLLWKTTALVDPLEEDLVSQVWYQHQFEVLYIYIYINLSFAVAKHLSSSQKLSSMRPKEATGAAFPLFVSSRAWMRPRIRSMSSEWMRRE